MDQPTIDALRAFNNNAIEVPCLQHLELLELNN
jgi:hypothetical protein